MTRLDSGSVVARASSVAWATLGDEVVVYLPRVRDVRVLNPTARLLWECLDGVSPLEEIFDDLADAYGVTSEMVALDCLPVVDDWFHSELATVPSTADANETPHTSNVQVEARWRRLAAPPSG